MVQVKKIMSQNLPLKLVHVKKTVKSNKVLKNQLHGEKKCIKENSLHLSDKSRMLSRMLTSMFPSREDVLTKM